MRSIVFDPLKHQRYLEKYKHQLVANDFLYRIGTEIILDSVIRRSSNKHNHLLLYGYFDNKLSTLKKLTPNITNVFIIPIYQDNCLCATEEDISFIPNTFDMAFSNLSLHFVNDLSKALNNYYQLLEENGLFVATIIGDYSFLELQESFAYADQQIYDGMFARIMPMIKSDFLLGLLQQVGFRHIVLHKETINLQYNNLLNLLKDLRRIGFGNFLANNTPPVSKNFLKIAEDYHLKNHAVGKKLNLSIKIITISALKL